MKNQYRLTAAVTALFCGISAAACAAPLDSYTINDTAQTVTVTGSIEGLQKNDSILIAILRPGKTPGAGKYTGTQILEDFVFLGQRPADENGGYTITVNMTGCETGAYPVWINGQPAERTLYYATTEAKGQLLEQIYAIRDGGAADAAGQLAVLLDLKNPLGTAINMFNLTDPAISAVSDRALCEILLPLLREPEPEQKDGEPEKPPKSDAEKAADKILLAAYIRGLDEGYVTIEDYLQTESQVFFEQWSAEKARMLDEAYVAAYREKLTEAQKQGFVTDYLRGKGMQSTADVQKRFQTAVCDCLIGDIGNWADVEYIITAFGADFGVNMTAFDGLTTDKKTKLYQAILAHGGFADAAALAAYCNSAMPTLGGSGSSNKGNSGNKGGGGGGSRGGSTGGSSGIPAVGATPIPAAEPEPAELFSDMGAYAWAKKSVETLAGMGIVNGTAEGKFEPSRAVTREEFLAMLLRAFAISAETSEESGFADVNNSDWFCPYVTAGKTLGLVNGVSADTFGVSMPVTREDAAVMAWRIAAYAGRTFDETVDDTFADDTSFSEYARPAVYALKTAGVIGGRENNLFWPKDTCNRAEAAKIIDTLLRVRGE